MEYILERIEQLMNKSLLRLVKILEGNSSNLKIFIGRKQAEFLGKRLSDVKDEYKFEKCVFSTMLRFFLI